MIDDIKCTMNDQVARSALDIGTAWNWLDWCVVEIEQLRNKLNCANELLGSAAKRDALLGLRVMTISECNREESGWRKKMTMQWIQEPGGCYAMLDGYRWITITWIDGGYAYRLASGQRSATYPDLPAAKAAAIDATRAWLSRASQALSHFESG